MDHPTNDLQLTPPALARRWGIRVGKVLAWIAAGELCAVNMATLRGGVPRWRISEDEAERFKRSRMSVAAPKPTTRRRRPDPTVKPYF
jgi:hypothetical protein